MKTASKTLVDTALREQWIRTVTDLKQQIKSWVAQEQGWTTEAGETDKIYEDALGDYTAPMLTIHSPEGELRVEPIARNYPGLGIVELYAWPTLRRVRLLPDKTLGQWRILTDSGIYLRQQWDRESFMALANDLIQAK